LKTNHIIVGGVQVH